MKSRLITYDRTPPGGYAYEQTEGIHRYFPSQPLIEAQAQLVYQFRASNHLSRASVLEALQDIDAHTCARLGNDPLYCVATDAGSVALGQSSPIISPCKGCGLPVE